MGTLTPLNALQGVTQLEPAAALRIVQQFQTQSTLRGLITLLADLLTPRLPDHDFHYHCDALTAPVTRAGVPGTSRPHQLRYGLAFRDIDLGDLSLQLAEPARREVLAELEDILALLLPSLHNAMVHETGHRATAAEPPAEDTLILLQLDPHPVLARYRATDLLGDLRDFLAELLEEAASLHQIDEQTLAILVPAATAEAGRWLAERLRTLVATAHLSGRIWQGVTLAHQAGLNGPGHAGTPQLTASLGIAHPRAGDSGASVLERARTALRQARLEGGNRYEQAL